MLQNSGKLPQKRWLKALLSEPFKMFINLFSSTWKAVKEGAGGEPESVRDVFHPVAGHASTRARDPLWVFDMGDRGQALKPSYAASLLFHVFF